MVGDGLTSTGLGCAMFKNTPEGMDPRAIFGTIIGATGRGNTFEFIPVSAMVLVEEALLPTDAMS